MALLCDATWCSCIAVTHVLCCSLVAAQVRLICKEPLVPLYSGAGFEMVGPSNVVSNARRKSRLVVVQVAVGMPSSAPHAL